MVAYLDLGAYVVDIRAYIEYVILWLYIPLRINEFTFLNYVIS